jgi:hypothetical protein
MLIFLFVYMYFNIIRNKHYQKFVIMGCFTIEFQCTWTMCLLISMLQTSNNIVGQYFCILSIYFRYFKTIINSVLVVKV